MVWVISSKSLLSCPKSWWFQPSFCQGKRRHLIPCAFCLLRSQHGEASKHVGSEARLGWNPSPLLTSWVSLNKLLNYFSASVTKWVTKRKARRVTPMDTHPPGHESQEERNMASWWRLPLTKHPPASDPAWQQLCKVHVFIILVIIIIVISVSQVWKWRLWDSKYLAQDHLARIRILNKLYDSKVCVASRIQCLSTGMCAYVTGVYCFSKNPSQTYLNPPPPAHTP